MTIGAHDLAVALGVETDLVAPIPRDTWVRQRGALKEYLAKRLSVSDAGRACPRTGFEIDERELPEDLGVRLTFDCGAPVSSLLVDYRLFFDIDPGHRSLGVIEAPGHREEFLLDRSFNKLELALSQPSPAEAWPRRFFRIFLLGAEHILIGFDHVVFLIALIIVSARFWPLVRTITAFTLAHSLTLGLAWHGVITLPGRLVEIAIALSIAIVAAENVLGRRRGDRWVLAGLFGLVHGLGFYSALSDLGLSEESRVFTLAAFNLGVEAGQLTIAAILFPLLILWSRRTWHGTGVKAISAAIALLAVWWTYQRAVIG